MKQLVRQRLAGPRPPRDVVAEAAARLRGTFPVDEWMARGPMRPAAVLVPLVDRPQGLAVLLTERNADLPDHPGQIAFPGGRLEPGGADAIVYRLAKLHGLAGWVCNTSTCVEIEVEGPPASLNVFQEQLRRDAEAVMQEVARLGEARIGEFDRSLLKPVRWEESWGRQKQAYTCDRCGNAMYEKNCKITCPNCGNRFDCSDLNLYFD